MKDYSLPNSVIVRTFSTVGGSSKSQTIFRCFGFSVPTEPIVVAGGVAALLDKMDDTVQLIVNAVPHVL